jgi:hypothetical protein
LDYFAGLDVSVKETSVCIVDDTGKIVREARVATVVTRRAMTRSQDIARRSSFRVRSIAKSWRREN